MYFNSADHVYYVDSTQHVNQLLWTGTRWVNNDLTADSGSTTLAAVGSALTTLYFNGSDHVYFFDTNGNVNQLLWTGSAWVDNNLTADSGSTHIAATGAGITSLYFSTGDRVYYIDTNQHVNVMGWTGAAWRDIDLTALARVPALAAPKSALSSLYFGGTDHIYYIDVNGNVNQLLTVGLSYVNNNLTADSGTSVVAETTSGLSSLYFNGADHVYYVDTNQNVDQLLWTGAAWVNNNLTADSGTSTIAWMGSAITSLYFNGADHVYYLGSNQDINQLFWDGAAWVDNNLTADSGSSALGLGTTGLTSLYFVGADHVYYVDTNHNVNQLLWTGAAWVNNNLTADSGTSTVTDLQPVPF
ncbi:MAG: hypothetical protein JOY54_01720 [Acidobacteriaceae bacterium]|nr:hypothetical protein [Acidobacteriaceae bacterium]